MSWPKTVCRDFIISNKSIVTVNVTLLQCSSRTVKKILLYIHTHMPLLQLLRHEKWRANILEYFISKCSIFSSTFLFFFTVIRVGRLGCRSRIGASDTWHATCVLLCDHVLWLSAVASTARCHARWCHSALLLFLGSLKNNNWRSTFCSRLEPKLLAADFPLFQKKKNADSRMCKVQNESRRAIGDLRHIWWVQTHKRLAEKTNKQQLSSCLCLFRVSSLQCGRCVSKFSLSPCIYTEYFSNICETRGPPALIGDLWSEGEAWNMYTTVVTVASRLSESSNKSAQVALQGRRVGGGGGYTHCLTHSGCIQNIVCDFRCGQ